LIKVYSFRQLRRVKFSSFPAPHRRNNARKSQPRNRRREIFTHGVEETARENVSASKKIACDAEKSRKLGRNSTARKDKYYCNIKYLSVGWGARIRTWEWRNQNPLPYHLATPHWRRAAAGMGAAAQQRARGPYWHDRLRSISSTTFPAKDHRRCFATASRQLPPR
jgi:hypothetical protein